MKKYLLTACLLGAIWGTVKAEITVDSMRAEVVGLNYDFKVQSQADCNAHLNEIIRMMKAELNDWNNREDMPQSVLDRLVRQDEIYVLIREFAFDFSDAIEVQDKNRVLVAEFLTAMRNNRADL